MLRAACSLGVLLLIIAATACSVPQREMEAIEAEVYGAPLPVIPGRNPFVHVDGLAFKDGSGKPLKLRGVNLGGWLLWEGWMWGGGFNSETAILKRLRDLVGPERVAKFKERYYDTFITEKDIAAIARTGFNVVRIPINHRLLTSAKGSYAPGRTGWQILDEVIGWCEKHNVYVVLDLHSAPGGQGWLFMADPVAGDRLWGSKVHEEKTVALWKSIATRYRSRDIIAGYNPLNEPVPKQQKQLLRLYRRIIDAIRSVDAAHMIILEGSDYSTNFSMFKAPLTNNQAYSFHMYTWFGDNRRRELDEYEKVARSHQIPFWNGEFGENQYDMLESTVDLYEARDYVSGWAFWSWKKTPNGSPYLLGIRKSEDWDKVVSWINWPHWPSKKPSAEQAWKGMREFLDAVRYENNIQDKKMIALLTKRLRNPD